MGWTHSDEQKLSYLRLLSREGALTAELRVQKEVLEEIFTELTGERFPGTRQGRIGGKLEDEYSLFCRADEERRQKEGLE